MEETLSETPERGNFCFCFVHSEIVFGYGLLEVVLVERLLLRLDHRLDEIAVIGESALLGSRQGRFEPSRPLGKAQEDDREAHQDEEGRQMLRFRDEVPKLAQRREVEVQQIHSALAERGEEELAGRIGRQKVDDEHDGDGQAEHGEEDAFARGAQVVGLGRIVVFDLLVHELGNLLAVLFQRVERVLDRLVDGLFNVLADVFDLIDAANDLKTQKFPVDFLLILNLKYKADLVRIGDVNGGHVKARLVESWPFAEFLHNLHHDPEDRESKMKRRKERKKITKIETNLCLSDSVPASSAFDR